VIPPFAKITGWKPMLDAVATGRAAKDYRKSAGVSGRRVARAIGISSSHVCDMESGRRSWTVEQACAYAAAVDQLRGNFHLTTEIKSPHAQHTGVLHPERSAR
jgi:transcriptional regulator with XRE-family HTH domain